tara:strand:+ start:69 stop:407 length:339 start_codon:yes stop_codon:yes gene_type:complete
MHYKKNVKEPWFSLIKNKQKIVEGRLNKGSSKEIKKNDIIKWVNGEESVITLIRRVTIYKNFKNYLEKEGLRNTLPHEKINNINDGINVYYKYYSKEDEEKYGILAIQMEVL